MNTSSVVKAVRLDDRTIQRITAHMERLQALWGPAVWVNEGMALRDVIRKGLDVVEGVAEQGVIPPEVSIEPIPQHTTIPPEATREKIPALPLVAELVEPSPQPDKAVPAHLRAIAEAYSQATHLILDEFAEVLYERNLYRAMDKNGHERPVNRGTLKKMLDRCRKLGLLR